MPNDQFRTNFAKVLKKAGDKWPLLIKKVAVDLGRKVVQGSPVDTGRFKSNWVYGNGTINTATTDATNIDAMVGITAGVETWTPGAIIYITNSLPYARRLEYGWSKQAPQGMVRLAVQDFKANVNSAAKAL